MVTILLISVFILGFLAGSWFELMLAKKE